MHNCEPQYHRAVHKLLDRYENVVIKSLNNDVRSPSAPRNHGMKFATAPYLGFLDADDSYTPRCLEKALFHIQKTNSQMVIFRREYELESDDLIPWSETILWNQTQEEIVIDRNNWDDQKMFSGVWGIVTGRLYDRKFLAENNITFDETVPYAEGALFLIEVCGKLERVCYLPQFIGYHYFINGGSIVQNMKKVSGAKMISYAEGFVKIFEATLRNGFAPEWTIAVLLTLFSNAMLQSKTLTLPDRQRIKEILEPYVRMIPILPVSKIDSAEAVKTYYRLPREVILHPENFDKGAHTQNLWNGQKILNEILTENRATDYGQQYYFSALRTAAGYQARVPLSNYATYAPLIELQTKVGERRIFVDDDVTCYLLTSGTTGEPRLIPSTDKHLRPYLDAFTKIVRGKLSFVLFESLPLKKRYNDRAFLNSVSGMVLSEFFRYERNTLNSSGARFTSPEDLLFPKEAMDTTYLRLLFALRERGVEQIISPFTWGIVEAFNFMEDNWAALCNDIEFGRITFALDVPEKFLHKMNGLLTAEPERADELRKIFRDGFDKPIAKRIWTKLDRIIAAGSGSFRIYTEHMKRYTGDLPHSNGFFASSEMFMGAAVDGDDYELISDVNFYEFLPVDAGENSRPLLLSQVEPSKDYEVILTNRAGLYRYRTEDIIRVKHCAEGRLIFSYVGRKIRACKSERRRFPKMTSARRLLRRKKVATLTLPTLPFSSPTRSISQFCWSREEVLSRRRRTNRKLLKRWSANFAAKIFPTPPPVRMVCPPVESAGISRKHICFIATPFVSAKKLRPTKLSRRIFLTARQNKIFPVECAGQGLKLFPPAVFFFSALGDIFGDVDKKLPVKVI
ncbi:MAG: GH3 auxin-responsive promoter family protein [Selenomonadaceae bacterium]|nr:GH3 auxin-responsive promoter family protein [Selenomonadaceae bacterium]